MGLDNPLHIAILLIILLLVFGAKRLPELGRSLGTGMRSFKESISGESHYKEHVEQLTATPAEPESEVRVAEPVAVAEPVGERSQARRVAEPVAEHSRVRPVA